MQVRKRVDVSVWPQSDAFIEWDRPGRQLGTVR